MRCDHCPGGEASETVSNAGRAPLVQIVVPVHDLSRPIRRAVESVLRCPRAGVIVVAHGLDPSDLDIPREERVEVVQWTDAVGMPGAAFNAGLDQARAPWVGIMGSDDWYEHGAVSTMLRHAALGGADGVLAPLRIEPSTGNTLNPHTWRRKRLGARADNLFSRTAPLGIYRRDVLQNPRYQMQTDVRAGEDQLSSVRMWTDGLRIDYYPFDPAYVVGNDARQRVTLTPRPLPEQAAMWKRVWEDPGVLSLPKRTKASLGEKFIRIHIGGWLAQHPDAAAWGEGEFEWLRRLALEIKRHAPSAEDGLGKTELAAYRCLLAGDLQGALRAASSDEPRTLLGEFRAQNLLSPSSQIRRGFKALAGRVLDESRDWVDRRPRHPR